MNVPSDQSFTYYLYTPDKSITFSPFTLSDPSLDTLCPIVYSLHNFADASTVAPTDPYSFSTVAVSGKI
jgi:hypothetical protein